MFLARNFLRMPNMPYRLITLYDSYRFEKTQNRIARLIIGTPLSTSTDKLIRDLGWTSLSEDGNYINSAYTTNSDMRQESLDTLQIHFQIHL